MPSDIDPSALSSALQIGDVVFIRVNALPFREVAAATDAWTNHVGIVVAGSGMDAFVAESTFPWSRITNFRRFVTRSEQGQLAIARLRIPPTPQQQIRLSEAVRRRTGILYDTGFNLHSRRQFCSRFVREILAEATGINVGEVESFAQLLARRPGASLGFWRLWYFGRIPWARETVTPASLLRSPELHVFFDGHVITERDMKPRGEQG